MIDILITDFVLIFLVFIRIFAAFSASIFFGNKSIPVVMQVALTFIISYIVFLSTDVTPDQFSVSIWFIFINSVKEIITGLIMGFSLNIIFWGVSYSGTLIGFDIGLAMAQVFNPIDGTSNNIIGEFLYHTAVMVFFIINGHHYFIQGLASSFSLIPIGTFTISGPVIELLVKYTGGVFVIAVKIASPVLVSFFLVHLAEGIIARVIPQMQVFFVTQPVKIGLGLSILAAIIPIYVYVIKNLLKSYEDSLFHLIRAMGT